MSKIKLLDHNWSIGENVDGLYVHKEQEITSEFLDALAEDRLHSKAPAKEFHKFASIPTVVVEKWLREGFDIYRESAKSIMKRLRQENLEAFICSSKNL